MSNYHDDVIKWKHFPRYWPFLRGIHRSPVKSPHKGQWRVALMFSLICAWINIWCWWFETPSCSLWRHCNDYCDIGNRMRVDRNNHKRYKQTRGLWSCGPFPRKVLTVDTTLQWRRNEHDGVSNHPIVYSIFCSVADQRKCFHLMTYSRHSQIRTHRCIRITSNMV